MNELSKKIDDLMQKSMDAYVLIETAHDLMEDDAIGGPNCRYLVGKARREMENLHNELDALGVETYRMHEAEKPER